MFQKVRKSVFWPPFTLLVLGIILSAWQGETFLHILTATNDFLLETFGLLFGSVVLCMLIVCIIVPFSKLGTLKIGGENAVPFFNKAQWFAIVLSTTIATGILFWATAEPMFHYIYPPDISELKPESTAAVYFSLATLYLHWSFSPYAIYTIPALLFAIAFYNQKEPFSLGATFFPLISMKWRKKLSSPLDSVALYALVMGMAASLSAGILLLKGGLTTYFQLDINENLLTIMIALVIIGSFTISAATGLLKGIKHLSYVNLIIFILLLIFILIFGFWESFQFVIPAMVRYITELPQGSLNVLRDASWANQWTTFNWANWMAWAPITALFLGRIAYGRTVREFMLVNWVLPSLFAILWISVFGSNILYIQHKGMFDIKNVLQTEGAEAIIYTLLDILPLGAITIGIFIFTVFLSYVTAADSNTEAMGGISSTGISPNAPAPPVKIKVIWGITVGITAWVAISFVGIDGIKMLSNLGGIPSLFLLGLMTIGLVKYMIGYQKGLN